MRRPWPCTVSSLPTCTSQTAEAGEGQEGLHRNAVDMNGETVVGTRKSNKSSTVALPAFVMAAMSTPICSTLTLTVCPNCVRGSVYRTSDRPGKRLYQRVCTVIG